MDFSYFQQELNEVETPSEFYPSTLGFVALLNSLVENFAVFLPPTEHFNPYLDFLLDSVAARFLHRSYKDVSQMVKFFCLEKCEFASRFALVFYASLHTSVCRSFSGEWRLMFMGRWASWCRRALSSLTRRGEWSLRFGSCSESRLTDQCFVRFVLSCYLPMQSFPFVVTT